MKKIISLLLAAVMVLGLLCACAGGGNDPSTPSNSGSDAPAPSEDTNEGKYAGVTINYWSMWNSSEPQGKVLQEAADEFQKNTGATINISWKGRELSNVILASLEAKDDVDMFEGDYAFISKTYKDYVFDLTEMAKAANYSAQSYACFNDVATAWAGFLPCITEQPQVGGIFYNKDIFADCGITAPPATWAEFLEDCQKMVDKGYEPMALDSAYCDFFMGYHLERHLGEAKVAELTANGGWSNESGAIAAAQEIIDFVKAGYLADGAPDEYPASQNKMGLTEKVAMVVCANYVCAEVNNNTGVELNWGMFNYPSVEGGVTTTNSYAGATGIAIAKHSANAQAAFDFALFLTSGEMDQKMANEASQIPADPRNTAPAIMDGTVETLLATTEPLSWGMGLYNNPDLTASILDWAANLFSGKFENGEQAIQALDALY